MSLPISKKWMLNRKCLETKLANKSRNHVITSLVVILKLSGVSEVQYKEIIIIGDK